jgi:hypothetical protein
MQDQDRRQRAARTGPDEGFSAVESVNYGSIVPEASNEGTIKVARLPGFRPVT